MSSIRHSFRNTPIQPHVHYPNQKTFWKEFWTFYCRITHFHGFHEMQISRDWYNRIFWITLILVGLALSVYLTVLGVVKLLSDPVDTHVTTVRQGEIDMPILYCPQNWIDKSRVSNGTEKYLLYALSYLRIPNYVYIPYEKMKPYSIHLQSPRYNYTPSELTNMTSFQVAVYLFDKTPPSYFNGSSRLVLGSIPSLSYLLQWSNDPTILKNDLYPMYLKGQSEQLFHYIYYNVTFSYIVARDVYQNVFRDNFPQRTSIWAQANLGRFTDDECFTLNDLDQIDIYGRSYFNNFNDNDTSFWPCHYTNPKYSSISDNTHLSYLIRKQQTFFKLFKGAVFTMICDHEKDKYCAMNKEEQLIRMDLETKRSQRMTELMSRDSKIARNKSASAEESVRQYLDHCCIDDEEKFISEVQHLVSKAERIFLKEEKLKFEKVLKANSFETPLEYLKNVSFDQSRFLVSFSMDSKRHIRPNTSNITSKLVMTAEGTCILFRIQLSANSFGGTVPDAITSLIKQEDDEDDEMYAGQRFFFNIYSLSPIKVAYVNIVARENTNSLFSTRDSNIISFGESAFFNTQEFFDSVKFPISFSKFQPTSKYTRFTFDLVRNVSSTDRSSAPCKDRDNLWDDSSRQPYSYNGCLLSCSDIYLNPKIVCSRSRNETTKVLCRELATCGFLAENPGLPKGMEPCSVFNLHQIYENWNPMPTVDLSTITQNNSECFQHCYPPCSTLTFLIHQMTDVEDESNGTTLVKMKNQFSATLNEKAKADLKKQGEILWMPESFFWYISTYLDQIYQHDQTAQSRIEIQITTELTTYTEQPSFTWDTLFGVIGGQIGIVMGASFLTLIQFFWLLIVASYRFYWKKE